MGIRVQQTAFFQWHPTISEANEIGDPSITEIRNNGFIQLAPDEAYTAISNYVDYDTARDLQMNFGDDYKVEIVDSCGYVLKDITPNVTIQQFNHIETGKFNIIFEVVSIGMEPTFYGRDVHFKITQTTYTDNVFYSNPFQINPDKRNSSHVAFRDYSVKFGNDYPTADVWQTCRIKGSFVQPKVETASETYTQENGNVIRKGAVPVFSYEYQVEYNTNFGVKAFEYMRGHSAIYIDGYRATNILQSPGDRAGASNFYDGKWTVYKDLQDYKNIGIQITPDFKIIPRFPLGFYTLESIPNQIVGLSNSILTLGIGTLSIYLSDGTLFHTFTQDDIIFDSSGFIIDTSGLDYENGSYYINWTYGLFQNMLGQVATIENGFWSFTISDPDWLAGDWLAGDFFTA